MLDKIVIVGNGIAAINAIKAIREINNDVGIDLFGEEKFYPYNRMKLSKSLFEDIQENSILLQKKDWYEENKVTLHLNAKVVNIDTSNNEIILFDDTRVKYDKLLLTTGACNRIPSIEGIDSQNAHTIRSLENTLSIYENIENKNTILNIGGGIQGLETAWILHQHGKKVIISEIQNRIMPYQLDEKASRMLMSIIESLGIKVLLNTQVEKISYNNNFECILNSNEKLYCDMIIYSIGISPNIDLLQNTNIKTNRGILVDNTMKTNIDNIYAAGDVAEFEGKINGLWNIAIGQAKTAGYNIAGKRTTYEHIVPVTTLNAFNISLFSMGKITENENTKTIIEEDTVNKTYKKILIENNKIIGAIVIGDTKKSPIFKTAIEKEILLYDNLDNISVDELIELLKTKEAK